MITPRTLPFLMLALPLAAPGANKDIVALQREVRLLQQQVSELQQSVEEEAGTLKALARQTLDGVSALSTRFVVLENSLADRLRQEQTILAKPVAGLDARTDRIASEVQSVSESIADLSDRLGRLQQQVIDVGKAVQTIQPAPPSGSTPGVSGGR